MVILKDQRLILTLFFRETKQLDFTIQINEEWGICTI